MLTLLSPLTVRPSEFLLFGASRSLSQSLSQKGPPNFLELKLRQRAVKSAAVAGGRPTLGKANKASTAVPQKMVGAAMGLLVARYPWFSTPGVIVYLQRRSWGLRSKPQLPGVVFRASGVGCRT